MKNENIGDYLIKINDKLIESNGKKGIGIPQIAIAFSNENNESIGPYINERIFNGKKISQKDGKKIINSDLKMYSSYHAEQILLSEIFKSENLEKIDKKSISLIISSHPCEYCILELSKYSYYIDKVIYISKSSYERKIEKYNMIEDHDKIFDNFSEIEINFQHFNSHGDLKLDIESKKISDRLNLYLVKFMNELLDGRIKCEKYRNGKGKRRKKINIKIYKGYKHYFDLIEEKIESKSVTIKNKKAIVDREKVCKIYRATKK